MEYIHTLLLLGAIWKCYVCHLTTDVLWTSCDTTICGAKRLNIQCEENSLILINNVTSSSSRAFDDVSYSNLRRTCLGMSICQTSRPELFCNNHRNVQFNVSYVCVRESLIDKSCDVERLLTNRTGFILSPNYPTETGRRTCKWKIDVPEGHYIHIFLHEVLPRNPGKCKASSGGINFNTMDPCGVSFPTYPICTNDGMRTTITSCSSIEILMLVQEATHAIRFWLSYHVVAVPNLQYVDMFKTDITCNVNVLDHFLYHKPEEKTIPVTNETGTNTTTVGVPVGESVGEDAVDYVVYIALVVGILVLIVVIAVATIYIRYRYCNAGIIGGFGSFRASEMKENIANSNSEIQRRPLPERQSTTDTDVSSGAVLQQSYSVVADEIPRSAAPVPSAGPAYSTYAEIEECSETGEKPKPPLVGKRSVDNSKRELPAKPNEAPASSIYFEIDDVDAKDTKTEKGSIERKNKRNTPEYVVAAVPDYAYKKKLSDASNIYAECEELIGKKAAQEVSKTCDKQDEKDEKPYMDMTHKRFVEESPYVAHTKHTKDSKDKVNQSKRSRVVVDKPEKPIDKVRQKFEKIATESEANSKKKGPSNVREVGKLPAQNKCSVTSESDSDDGIVVVENELYEPFETAKV